MTTLRQILSVKLITIFALSALFVSTAYVGQAQAGIDFNFFNQVKCPCDFLGATLLAKKEARSLGGTIDIDFCEINPPNDGQGIVAEGEGTFCFANLQAQFSEVSFCAYEFSCEGENTSTFLLQTSKPIFSEEEFEACKDKIEIISQIIFREECVEDD